MKQPLSEEFQRMQKLAGIITEAFPLPGSHAHGKKYGVDTTRRVEPAYFDPESRAGQEHRDNMDRIHNRDRYFNNTETSSEDSAERAALTRVFDSSKVDSAIVKGVEKMSKDQKNIFKQVYDRIKASLGLKEADEYGSGGFDNFENRIGTILQSTDVFDKVANNPNPTIKDVQGMMPVALKAILSKIGASGVYDPNTANLLNLAMQDTVNTSFLNNYATSVGKKNVLPKVITFLIAGVLWEMGEKLSNVEMEDK